jgi:acetyltransferase-like isoleucine patch superfamily enzyme
MKYYIKIRLIKLIDFFLNPLKVWVVNTTYRMPYVHGSWKRINLGINVSLMNTVLNTASGNIYIEDDVIFGHNCMVLTGRHDFKNGKRKVLSGEPDTPFNGYDIIIKRGSWLASGSIVIGGVTIGENSIVAAGSIVTKSIPDNSIVAGIPAKIIGTTKIQ